MRTKKLKPNKASNAPTSLVGRMSLIVYLMVIGLLTSCQSGPYSFYQPQRPTVVHIFYERPPSKTVPPSSQKSVVSRVTASKGRSSQTARTQPSSRLPQNQSKRVHVPTPVYEEYSARWDKRKVSDSKDGVYWVVDRWNRTWRMKPTEFWPFWAKHIYLGGRMKIYDPYSP
jgi:hypothetical protein